MSNTKMKKVNIETAYSVDRTKLLPKEQLFKTNLNQVLLHEIFSISLTFIDQERHDDHHWSCSVKTRTLSFFRISVRGSIGCSGKNFRSDQYRWFSYETRIIKSLIWILFESAIWKKLEMFFRTPIRWVRLNATQEMKRKFSAHSCEEQKMTFFSKSYSTLIAL